MFLQFVSLCFFIICAYICTCKSCHFKRTVPGLHLLFVASNIKMNLCSIWRCAELETMRNVRYLSVDCLPILFSLILKPFLNKLRNYSWYTPKTKVTANSDLFSKLHSVKLSLFASQQHKLPIFIPCDIFDPMCVIHTILYRSNPSCLTCDLTSSEIRSDRSRQTVGS